MKEIKISVVLFLSCIGLTYAQDLTKNQKVESPYRLIRGVVLKTDLTMTAATLNKVVQLSETNDKELNLKDRHDVMISRQFRQIPFWLNPSMLHEFVGGRGVVIDGSLLKQK
ncbi:hypothetical protein [Croceitalea rosinachiae]|uniref:Uncharacterized protein n=1 Tax=Croceitalea rosinachiae TaxID=3075596 RepID=A0ABU3AB10_9FLAO|nr:hypothetical protein [Croceitalea sp. F388]MDT0607373.1 hypothetical protein [Croceitalea sp. F388]